MEVLEWEDIPAHILAANHPIAYDSPDAEEEGIRQEVDMEIHPIMDLDGHEIYVYDSEGYRIIRRSIVDKEEGGGLLDLSKVHTLFDGMPDGFQAHGEHNAVKYMLYPLGFSKKYGNVQANGVIVPFAKKMRQLDAVLRNIPNREEPEELADHLESDEAASPQLLHPISCQIYNAISHRVRDAAKFHEVQLAMFTNALAGCTAQTLAGKNRWRRILERVRQAMPHQRFAEKVAGDDQPQCMRFENTYQLDVQKLTPRKRSGECVTYPPCNLILLTTCQLL